MVMIFVNMNIHINQVPSPNTAIFISKNNHCLFMSEACSAAIRSVVVASEVVEKFTAGHVEQPNM
jgi:hypothetical protein